MNKSERVETIFHDMLYRDDEIVDGEPVVAPVGGTGVRATYGFHPDRLESHRAEIRLLLADFPDEFYTEPGGKGGWSFLQFCHTKTEQWTGLHERMEQLMAMGVATGDVTILMPREMWDVLPGGMPYFVIKDGVRMSTTTRHHPEQRDDEISEGTNERTQTTMTTTPDTITTEQIQQLMREAAEAGDELQVMICRIALADGLTDCVDPGEHRAALEDLGIIPEHIDADVRAAAECARVIADAEAQQD